MTITLERFDDAFGFKATAGNHEILLDGSPEIGGSDQGARPMQLMLVSLAGCSAIDILQILKKGRHAVGAYKAEVRARRREELPKIFTEILLEVHIETDAPDGALERAAKLTREKYCSAFAILQATAQVELVLKRA